jgi:hypothetical protein
MKKLETLILKLESAIPHHELIAPNISIVSVGWHIEHSLLTLDSIINSLGKSNPDDYKRSFDIRRTVVMLLRKFPRGKIKAPKAVRPATGFNSDTLSQHIVLSGKSLKMLEHLSAGHYFTHPFLGDFKLKAAIQFMKVHTNHHLHIINEIIASKT